MVGYISVLFTLLDGTEQLASISPLHDVNKTKHIFLLSVIFTSQNLRMQSNPSVRDNCAIMIQSRSSEDYSKGDVEIFLDLTLVWSSNKLVK